MACDDAYRAAGLQFWNNASPVFAIAGGNQTTAKLFLTQTGTGTCSEAPVWSLVVAADLPLMVGDTGSGGVQGAVPAPAAGYAAAGKFLKADGTWAVPGGGGGGSFNTI